MASMPGRNGFFMPRPAASVRGGVGHRAGGSAAPGGDGATVRLPAVGGRRPTVTVAPGRWRIRGASSSCRRSAPPGRARAAAGPGATGRAGRRAGSCPPAPAIRRGPGRWVAGNFPNFAGEFPAVGPGGAPFAPGLAAVRLRPLSVPALRSPISRAPPPVRALRSPISRAPPPESAGRVAVRVAPPPVRALRSPISRASPPASAGLAARPRRPAARSRAALANLARPAASGRRPCRRPCRPAARSRAAFANPAPPRCQKVVSRRPSAPSRRRRAAATGLSPVKTGLRPVKTGIGPVFGARIGVGGRTLAGGAGPARLSET